MTTPDYFLPEQFCNSGVQSIDYVIPPISSADPAAASLETGAPPLQQVRPSLGGAAFPRQQYNGALRLLSNILTYLNKGGEFTFDPKNTAGYALDAVLYDYASKRYVVSLHNANTANFVTNPALINNIDWAFLTVTPAMLNDYARLASPSFTGIPTAPTVQNNDNMLQLVNVETFLAGLNTKQNSLGFVPVQQGGGFGQVANKINIGKWGDGGKLLASVDGGNYGFFVFEQSVIGISQAWNVVTGNRALNVYYTNNTGKAIEVCISFGFSAASSQVVINISNSGYIASNLSDGDKQSSVSFIVPNGVQYAATTISGNITINTWAELR